MIMYMCGRVADERRGFLVHFFLLFSFFPLNLSQLNTVRREASRSCDSASRTVLCGEIPDFVSPKIFGDSKFGWMAQE